MIWVSSFYGHFNELHNTNETKDILMSYKH